jgi:hypothetical protein
MVGSDTYLLRGLLEGDPTFHFTTIDDLEGEARRFRDQRQGEYLVFTGVSQNMFQQLGNEKSSVLYHSRLLYIHNLRTLRIKMAPSAAHDTAVISFTQLLGVKFHEMQAFDKVAGCGTEMIHMENVDKQPDGCWGPIEESYVTCVLEVGLSESQSKLALSARLWLEKPETPESHIHQVFTIKVTPDRPHIVFRKWERARQEFGATQSGHPIQAQMTEEVEIFLDNNVFTANGSLTLSFTKLLDRPPSPGTPERENIIFTRKDFTTIARAAWRKQDLIPREMVIA